MKYDSQGNESTLRNDDSQSIGLSLERLQELLNASEVGMLDEAETEELQTTLAESKSAQEYYAQWQIQSFLLADSYFEAQPLSLPPQEEESNAAALNRKVDHVSATRSSRWLAYLAIAGAVLTVCLSSRLLYLEFWKANGINETSAIKTDGFDSNKQNPISKEEKSSGIALVTRVVNMQLAEGSQRVLRGEALSPGVVALDSGIAQIEFYCGATVVVEGPARLELVSDKVVRCERGKIRAQVPPAARGFEVFLNNRRIVDLGTEFGVEVNGEIGTLEVFDGEVELHGKDQNAPPKTLLAGNSAQWNADAITFEEQLKDSFLDIDGLQEREQQRNNANFRRWQEHSQKLRTYPDLIAYYAMDDIAEWNRKLPSSIDNSELDGAIVGAKVRRGRWQSKKALEFKHPGDRIRVDIPGEFSSLTFCCWVKIDSLDRWYNSLFLTDNYQQGEPHWQILDTGQLFFSVRVSRKRGGPKHQEVLSPVFWTPSMSGKWIHLATTYDTTRKETTHYLNGRELSREALQPEKVVSQTRIGLASIGNWTSPTKPDEEFAIRNLNGRMDEFMIFSKALSSEEILELFENGKP
ncbi:MAG: LamG-like jellyroll fold domain-containing protein [Planctomycetota bacterium]